MSSVHLEQVVDDCGNSRCTPDAGCRGHKIEFDYTTSVDVGYVTIDGEFAFGGGDNLLLAVADLINSNERW